MAEDHINTAFGAIGALDVIFRRCMEGFAFWQRISDSSEPAKDFQILLDMQRVKLAIWAQGWGIESNSHHKDRRFYMYEAAVTNYLRVIYRIFSDFGSPETPVPVLNQTREFVSMDVLPRVNHFGASPGPYGLESLDPPTGYGPALWMHGIKWVRQEGKLKQGLALLTTLLNDLYIILPPPHIDPAYTLVLSDSLTSQDPNELARISRVENNDPIHAALAWMKSVAYRPYGAHLGNNQLQTPQLVPISREKGEVKFMARYQGELVFVEEKHCTAPWNQLEQLRILKARIDSIVVRLQNPDKPADLRTLPCRGGAFSQALSTTEKTSTWTYNIVYRADCQHFIALRKILGRTARTDEDVGQLKARLLLSRARLPLGKRFVVAQMLARTLMYLHLADWLHKAVRSENVIFFVDDENSVQSNLPYLIGFEHSRPDVPEEETENIYEKPDHKYYRHPKATAVPVADHRQPLGGPGRYSKVYDTYSMGVVLVEIGLFATAEKIVGKHLKPEDQTSEEIRRVLVDKAIPDLRFTMGHLYADAALACLDGSLDKLADQSLHKAFYNNVVRQLDSCHA